MVMVTQHGALVFLRKPDILQLDTMEDDLQIQENSYNLIEMALLELVEQSDVIPEDILMVMTMDPEEILPVVMIIIPVLVQGDLASPIREQAEETVIGALTEMVVMIRILEISPAGQAMKMTTLRMIRYYN